MRLSFFPVCLSLSAGAILLFVLSVGAYADVSLNVRKTVSQLDGGKAAVKPVGDVSRPMIKLAQARSTVQRGGNSDLAYERRIKNEVNQWVLGLAAGKLVGTPIRLAAELASVVDDGKRLNVVPMITRGPSANVHALLFMRGVDLAIINADILDYYKRNPRIANIQNRINYITQLFHSEFHVLARPEIHSIEDLRGKVVNFNTKGTSASFSGPEILKRMGIKVKEKFISHKIALKEIRKNKKISALVFVTGKSIKALNKIKWPAGFRLLPANYSSRLTDYYLPSVLTHRDYPGLIVKGETVTTVAVPTVLVSYNWRPESRRYRRVARFVDYMFRRWGRLQKAPFHKKWRNINLTAKVPGWKRLPVVQAHLDRIARLRKSGPKDSTFQVRKSKAALRRDFEVFLRKYARVNNVNHFTREQKEELFRLFYKFSQETDG